MTDTEFDSTIKIGIADDQQIFVKSLAALINTFPGFAVVTEALNGKNLLEKISSGNVLPDILLLDVNMPIMDGLETAGKVMEHYAGIKMVALSMKDDDTTIINMLKAGCCAYLLKDIHPDELQKAMLEIKDRGYYNADAANINYRRLIIHSNRTKQTTLSDRELAFLHLACSDLTYKQIAASMHLAERTIDGYRESIFEKLNVQSRVGMALEAVRLKLVEL